MNKRLSLNLYNLLKKNNAINFINICIGKWSSRLFFFVYSVACIFLVMTEPEKILNFILTPLLLLNTNILLRKVFKKTRPQYVYTKVHNKKSYSFPSNHSACSSVIATVCFFINPMLGICMFIFSFLTGISRVMSGFHYLSDVLAGWILGVLFGVVGFIYF